MSNLQQISCPMEFIEPEPAGNSFNHPDCGFCEEGPEQSARCWEAYLAANPCDSCNVSNECGGVQGVCPFEKEE